jgi:hypothetical protein
VQLLSTLLQNKEKKMMSELKLRSKDPYSLKQIIQSALLERLHSVEAGIKRTEERH